MGAWGRMDGFRMRETDDPCPLLQMNTRGLQRRDLWSGRSSSYPLQLHYRHSVAAHVDRWPHCIDRVYLMVNEDVIIFPRQEFIAPRQIYDYYKLPQRHNLGHIETGYGQGRIRALVVRGASLLHFLRNLFAVGLGHGKQNFLSLCLFSNGRAQVIGKPIKNVFISQYLSAIEYRFV